MPGNPRIGSTGLVFIFNMPAADSMIKDRNMRRSQCNHYPHVPPIFFGGNFINQACFTDRLSSRSMPCSISIGSGEKCAYFDLVISVDTAVVSCHY